MSQLHYLTKDIHTLDAAEQDLERNGIPRKHIHIFSLNEQEIAEHQLPSYSEWSKRDITYFGLLGMLIGICLAICLLVASAFLGLTSQLNWAILGMLTLFILGFCTWEGGLIGMDKINHLFSPYKQDLEDGAHLLIVDVDNAKEEFKARYTVESHGIQRAALA